MRAYSPQLYPSTRATARNSTAGQRHAPHKKKAVPPVWGTAL